MLFRLFFIVLFTFYTTTVSAQTNKETSRLDSIKELRKLAGDNALSQDEKLKFAKAAVALSLKTNEDSTILKSNRVLSFVYLYKGDFEPFKTINIENLQLSEKLKDSFAIAVANHNLGVYFHIKNKNDSAFYYYTNAVKIYDKIGNIRNFGDALLNMAAIQQYEKDYIGSEDNAIKAIKLIQQLPKDESSLSSLWFLNNILGGVSTATKSYDKAIDYYNKAIEISEQMTDGLNSRLTSKNNMAFTYKEKGDVQTALKLYQEVLNTKDFFKIDPSFYSLALDNVTFAKFLLKDKNYDALEKNFKRAYKISDSLEDNITKMAVAIDLSKFYEAQHKMDSSFKYAKESYKIAKETKSNDMVLESLMTLSNITKGEKAKNYLNQYIKLNDSLIDNERVVKNKFARIKFETDQIELENQRISRERFWLMMISGVLLLTLFLLYIIITQRSKNKELRFKQSQQEANEEIYNLMLSQQDKIDEARAGEKKRISEELHDGILGRLFGTRLSLDSFNFSEGKDAIQTRSKYISELKIIEEDIRKISHDLNTDFVSGSGFIDILKELIEAQTQAYQLKYTFDYTDEVNWEMVTNKTKINIYRIIQESLQNTYKHANATLIKISIQLKNDVICLAITDDGKGFDMNKSKKGIGLKNINSRVKEFNGNVKFNSEPNKGTTIKIEIPYTN